MNTTGKQILCVGECMVEFSQAGEGLWRRGFAGDSLNVAWALRARLPGDYAIDYVTRIGPDAISDEMRGFFDDAQLGTRFVQRDPKRSVGLYSISTDAKGERSFSYWRSHSAAKCLADDPVQLTQALQSGDLIYLSGISAAVLNPEGRENLLAALTEAKAAGAIIAYDPNYRPILWGEIECMRDFTQRICALSAIVMPTFDDEQAAFGDTDPSETIDRIAQYGCSEIIVKDGLEPTHLYWEGGITRLPVAAPVQPVDTTGAGDSFNGAYLAGRLQGQPGREAVLAAQAVSAEVVMHRGALIPFDTIRSADAGHTVACYRRPI